MCQKGSERYFFALWPGKEKANEIYSRTTSMIQLQQLKAIMPNHLHLTLVYLGSLDLKSLKQVQHIANLIKLAPFELTFEKIASWKKSKILFLGLGRESEELKMLVAHLRKGLSTMGLNYDERTFKPHITLARHINNPVLIEQIVPIIWRINRFYLVKSTVGGAQSNYEMVSSWEL